MKPVSLRPGVDSIEDKAILMEILTELRLMNDLIRSAAAIQVSSRQETMPTVDIAGEISMAKARGMSVEEYLRERARRSANGA